LSPPRSARDHLIKLRKIRNDGEIRPTAPVTDLSTRGHPVVRCRVLSFSSRTPYRRRILRFACGSRTGANANKE
jgi:hypothetical protein